VSERDIIVGITGASGAIYARALVCELLAQDLTVHLIPTAHAAIAWRRETDEAVGGKSGATPATEWSAWLGVARRDLDRLIVYDDGAIEAPPASGTFRARAMVVVPCSMNTLAKIAHGISETLLTRAAAV